MTPCLLQSQSTQSSGGRLLGETLIGHREQERGWGCTIMKILFTSEMCEYIFQLKKRIKQRPLEIKFSLHYMSEQITLSMNMKVKQLQLFWIKLCSMKPIYENKEQTASNQWGQICLFPNTCHALSPLLYLQRLKSAGHQSFIVNWVYCTLKWLEITLHII